MIPGTRGIFDALLGGISDKYNIPYIFVEWTAILIFWGLYVFFGPERFSSFDVYLNGVDAFPNIKFPKIIWIGTDMRGGNLLNKLSQKIQKMLEPLGFFPDKSFKPHITIFRIKKRKKRATN